MQIAPKLQAGDEIRVISPAKSVNAIGGMGSFLAARERLEGLGYKVTFGKNIEAPVDSFKSTDLKLRLEDLMEAYSDEDVKCVLCSMGGFNSNELLPYIDWEVIKNNPKILVGNSDITALSNAIFAKTGIVAYSGATYTLLKMTALGDYQAQAWQTAMTQEQYELRPSQQWGNDPIAKLDQERELFSNQWKVYNPGQAQGTAIISNLNTFGLLQGTPYMPQVDQPVLFVEASSSDNYDQFARNLASILQVYPNPAAVVIGRFQPASQVPEETLLFILDKHSLLKEIPVMYNLNFGHTQPIFTFPIGGTVEVDTEQLLIKVLKG